jgi:hypothetical protein
MPSWPTMAIMSNHPERNMIKWWAMLLAGVAAALVFAWLGRVAGVTMATLLSIGAGGIALAWLVVLVTVPWNLYFAARQAVADAARSRERGISVRPGSDAEAGRLARRMLWFAVGSHLATTVAAAVITYVSGRDVGYYFAGFFLLSTVIRPGLAYLAHVRERITALSREIRYPRDDVLGLRTTVDTLSSGIRDAQAELVRLRDAQARDRTEARSRDDTLERRVNRMARQIEATLDGLSDHEELAAGIRALARMFRTESA